MLVAMTQERKQINLLEVSLEEVQKFKKRGSFLCPACQQPVILKAGSIKIPHFAHVSRMDCESFSEGETQEHIIGKQKLARWCEAHQLSYQLEAYLPKLRQRPDLLIEGKIVIEFQCSRLSVKKLIERTKNYKKHHYQVYWILGSQFFLDSHLTNLHKLFLDFYEKIGFQLWFFDYLTNQLEIIYHIENFEGVSTLFYQTKRWRGPIENIKIILDFPTTNQLCLFRSYDIKQLIQANRQMKNLQLMRKQKEIMRVQFYLYQKYQMLQELPELYFLPVNQIPYPTNYCIYLSLAFWETFLEEENQVIDLLNYMKSFQKKKLQLTKTEVVVANVSGKKLDQIFIYSYFTMLSKLSLVKISQDWKTVIKIAKYNISDLNLNWGQISTFHLKKYGTIEMDVELRRRET